MNAIRRGLSVFGVLVIISLMLQPVAASYQYSKVDYQYDYLIGPIYYLGEDAPYWYVYSSLPLGKAYVDGDTGYADTCILMLYGMRFMATENGDCYFGAAWALEYLISSGAWFGLAYIDIHYVLKSDSDVTLNSQWVVKYQAPTGSSISGTATYGEDQYEHFSANLQANTYYRVYIEVKYWIGWYSSIHRVGSDNSIFDVSGMIVSSNPISG